jgi:hypothetical protein
LQRLFKYGVVRFKISVIGFPTERQSVSPAGVIIGDP